MLTLFASPYILSLCSLSGRSSLLSVYGTKALAQSQQVACPHGDPRQLGWVGCSFCNRDSPWYPGLKEKVYFSFTWQSKRGISGGLLSLPHAVIQGCRVLQVAPSFPRAGLLKLCVEKDSPPSPLFLCNMFSLFHTRDFVKIIKIRVKIQEKRRGKNHPKTCKMQA